jgi:UDP-glucose 4-epimerase
VASVTPIRAVETGMKIVITGGAGFIGANLARHLEGIPEIAEVVAYDDLSFGFESNLEGSGVRLVEGSILDQELLEETVRGAHAVVHLAARGSVPRSIAHPVATHDVNATGTLRVLEAARHNGGTHVVMASSSSVYGATDVLPKHESLPTRPISPYAASKLAAESYVLAWGHAYDLPTLAFRFFNVFGPLQAPVHSYAAVVPAFLASAMRGQPLPVHGDGRQCRDFTYVDSVVAVLTDAIIRQVAHPDPVNLAFGTRVSLLEVIAELEGILGRRLDLDFQPSRPGDVPRSQAANETLTQLFPDISPTDLRTGLQATTEWFESTRPWDPVPT